MNRRQFMLSCSAMAGLAAGGPGRAGIVRNPVLRLPKLNQIGFTPLAAKRFAVTGEAGRTFEVVATDGTVAFRGRLSPQVFDLKRTAGEQVAQGDFSTLAQPGRYQVRVGQEVSHPFEIGDDVYRPLLHDAARCFYLIRANAKIDDAPTGLRIEAGHLSEKTLMVDGVERDLTGGWYNAGDFGKYSHMAALSVSHMLRLYELRPRTAEMSLDMAPLYPGLPDLLQLARWGVEWLLKMQNPDGSVLHKVDSQPALTWGQWPVDDPNPRQAMAASTIDAGVLVGVMGHAARVLAAVAPDVSARCRAAARQAWAWLSQHQDVSHNDTYYLDPDPRQEIVWAMCEMALLEGAGNADIVLPEIGAVPFYWPSPQVLGLMSLALNGHPQARQQIIAGARSIADRAAGDAYGFSPLPESYVWGSNEAALNQAAICLYADRLQPDPQIRAAAQGLLDYILGRNALDHAFVTGYGARPTRQPFHWIYNMQKVAIPGWASGGANGQAGGADSLLAKVIAAGTPPAKCFVDAGQNEGSYASNEGETSENAALVFVTGMLAQDAG